MCKTEFAVDQQFSESSQRAESFEWDYGCRTASGLDGITHEHTFTADGSTTTTRSVTLTVEASGGCRTRRPWWWKFIPKRHSTWFLRATKSVLFHDGTCGGRSDQPPWDFGDNTLTSTVPNPVHVYENNTDQPVTYTLAPKPPLDLAVRVRCNAIWSN